MKSLQLIGAPWWLLNLQLQTLSTDPITNLQRLK